MRLREIAAAAGLLQKAPFHFVPIDLSAEDFEYTPAHCSFISRQELEDFLAGRQQEASFYGMNEQGIFLPDVYAGEFFFLEERHNRISTMAYMRMINAMPQVDMEIESYDLLFAAFVILHEYGHWLHFRRCHKTSLDYVFWLNKFLAPVEKQREVLELIPDSEPLKEGLVVEHINAYNVMPQEFSANKYALKHIAALYEKLLKTQNKKRL